MNRENYLTAVVAVLCILAVGFSATSLDTALGTDPDDVVDLEYDKLPIGKDDAGNLERQVKSNKQQGQGGGGGEGDSSQGQSEGSGSDSTSSSAPSEEGNENSGGSDGKDASGGGGSGEQPGMAPQAPPQLFDYLPWLLLLVILALAYRYRRRLLSLALALLGAVPEPEEDEEEEVTAQWRGVEPSNDVHRAWLAMVNSLPVERPWTRTPTECAEIARAAGADSDAVEQITRTFEEVRYGGRPVTDERRQRAREGIERLRSQGEGL